MKLNKWVLIYRKLTEILGEPGEPKGPKADQVVKKLKFELLICQINMRCTSLRHLYFPRFFVLGKKIHRNH